MSNHSDEKDFSLPIQVTLNGQVQKIPAGLTVLGLLERLGLPIDRVAVELDREIVRKPAWADTPVRDGAVLEVVHFVGGGKIAFPPRPIPGHC